MIQRNILDSLPERVQDFDWFNDYRDTITWLYGIPISEDRNRAIKWLYAGRGSRIGSVPLVKDVGDNV